jgi:sterol desaturase/sphingolipid hydroxylase (fatty acid hydroxylase superfamily)
MGPTLTSVAVGFLLLGLVFTAVERLRPAVAGRPFLRRGFRTDLAYWFFTPLVTKAISRVAIVAALVSLALAAGVPLRGDAVRAYLASRTSPVRLQPTWLQAVEVLLLGDLIGYWMHRLFHGPLWKFHAIHHSSKDLDWLSSVRLHPVNDVLTRLAQVVPFFLLGFAPTVLVAYVPFLTLHAIFLHANVPWSFGPLRHVVSSPSFHRWHHTSQSEGLDKNFAGLFPFWDTLFGTLYLPKGRQPTEFGVLDKAVPDGFWKQLAYPFGSAH